MTPDQNITGYGGQSSTGPSTPSTHTSATPADNGQNRASQATSGQSRGSQGTEDMKNDAKDKARQAADQVKNEAKNQGQAQFEQYRGTAADELERVAQGAKAAASEMEGDQLGLSRYVSDAAQSMVRLADDLRHKNVDELFQDVNRMARENPGLFIAGSVALGFGLTRFARASSQRAASDDYDRGHTGSSVKDRMKEGMHGDHGSTDTGTASGMGTASTTETYMVTDRVETSPVPSQRDLNDPLGSDRSGTTVGTTGNAGASTGAPITNTGTSTPTTPTRNTKGTDGGLLP